jgi:hypothetical protein
VPSIDPATLRTVHLITQIDAFKALYFDRDGMALRPNLVFVDAEGSVVFETNEIGLKGDALDPGRRLAVVWGDSVVFGSGRGWAYLLDRLAPGYQFLNGGLNGDPYGNILRRARGLNGRVPVALNLLMLGWHPLMAMPADRAPPRWDRLTQGEDALPRLDLLRSGNDGLRAQLSAFLEATPNTVVLTMPTALNARSVERDLSEYLAQADDETGFEFLGDLPYRLEYQRLAFDHIVERNAVTREVCASLGVRVVDLFAAFDTEDAADFREHFRDIIHLRPRSYPLLAQVIHEQIKDLLR